MIITAVEWLGRKGAKAIAASLFLGLAVPPASALARPLLPVAIFLLLVLAFMRVDTRAVARHAGRPALPLMAVAWMMLALPLLAGTAAHLLGLATAAPGIMVALVLMASGPPINSTPAFCYLLGLNGALSLAVLVAGTTITPLVSPVMTSLLIDQALPLAASDLALRLAVLLAGSAAVAIFLRTVLGRDRIAARGTLIDGLNVLLMFLFAVAIMDGVAARFIAEPLLITGLIALSFLVAGLFMATTALLFRRAGWEMALTLAISAGNRNLGLLAAALSGSVPELTWIYFALAQFPIYLLPVLMTPLVRRLTAETAQ